MVVSRQSRLAMKASDQGGGGHITSACVLQTNGETEKEKEEKLTLVAKLTSNPSVHLINTSYSLCSVSSSAIVASPSWSRLVDGPYVSTTET
jgi:hypothetical protein